MRQIGIKALKNELSQHIRAVRSGETIAVTDRGHVVAEITPPRRAVADGEDAILADHARRGLVRMATAGKGEPPPRRLSTVPFDQLMNDLDESRSDR